MSSKNDILIKDSSMNAINKEEHVEVTGAATTSSLKRNL